MQEDSDRRYMMAEDELLEPIDFTLATPQTVSIPVALKESAAKSRERYGGVLPTSAIWAQ